MSEKSLETQFNKELDQYISGDKFERQGTSSEEYDELLSIGKALWDDKVCENINEDKLRSTFMAQIEQERENEKMKKGKSLKKMIAVASMVAVLGVGISQTALAEEIISSIKDRFTTGYSSVVQIDKEKEKQKQQETLREVPEGCKGKIFDAEGKELEYLPMYLEDVYNKDGEPIIAVIDDCPYTEVEYIEKFGNEEEEEEYPIVTEVDKINDYTSFEVKMPTYLTEGVTFSQANIYCEMGIGIEFINSAGERAVYMDVREKREGAQYETCTYDEIVEVDINGVKGLMFDNSLTWETEDTIYTLMSIHDDISREEMI